VETSSIFKDEGNLRGEKGKKSKRIKEFQQVE
jgi:hypothetical protein